MRRRAAAALLLRTAAAVTFQRETDILSVGPHGFASDDDRLPRGNLTISVVARVDAYRTTDRAVLFMSSWDLLAWLDPAPAGARKVTVVVDSLNVLSATPAAEGSLAGDSHMSDWHRYTISYDKAADEVVVYVCGGAEQVNQRNA